MRVDKDHERPCLTKIFNDIFIPFLLPALENGFGTSTPNPIVLWNHCTEVLDACVMGPTGKRNLVNLFADTNLRARIFNLIIAIPIIPSRPAQFNLFITTTRILRHARKFNPDIVTEIKNIGTVSNHNSRSLEENIISVDPIFVNYFYLTLFNYSCFNLINYRYHLML